MKIIPDGSRRAFRVILIVVVGIAIQSCALPSSAFDEPRNPSTEKQGQSSGNAKPSSEAQPATDQKSGENGASGPTKNDPAKLAAATESLRSALASNDVAQIVKAMRMFKSLRVEVGIVPDLLKAAAKIETDAENRYPAERRYDPDALAALTQAGPAAIPSFVVALRDPDPSVRRVAAFVLGVLGRQGEQILPALQELLSQPDLSVKRYALLAIATAGTSTPVVTKELERLCEESSMPVRSAAVYALGRVNPQAVVSQSKSLDCLTDEAPQVRRWAVKTLANSKLPGREAIPAFTVAWVNETQDTEREKISVLLRKLSPPPTSTPAKQGEYEVGGLDYLGPDALPAVARMIAILGEPEDPSLAAVDKKAPHRTIPNPKAGVRARAARVLGLIKTTSSDSVLALYSTLPTKACYQSTYRSRDALNRYSTQESVKLRFVSLDIYDSMSRHSHTAIKPLLLKLTDKDPAMRKKAVQLIGFLKRAYEADKPENSRLALPLGPAVEPVFRLLSDSDPSVRISAVATLGALQIVNDEIVEGLVKATEDPDSEMKVAALQALASLGDPAKSAATDPVTRSLSDPDPAVRMKAVQTLGTLRIVNEKILVGISVIAADPDKKLKMSALDALAALGEEAKSVADKVQLALQDPDPDVQFSAARALVNLDLSRASVALPILREKLKSDPYTTAPLIGKLGAAAQPAVPDLAAILERTPSRQTRIVIAKALGALKEHAREALPALEALMAGKFERPGIRFPAEEREILQSRQAAHEAALQIDPAATAKMPAALELKKVLTDNPPSTSK